MNAKQIHSRHVPLCHAVTVLALGIYAAELIRVKFIELLTTIISLSKDNNQIVFIIVSVEIIFLLMQLAIWILQNEIWCYIHRFSFNASVGYPSGKVYVILELKKNLMDYIVSSKIKVEPKT